MLTENAAARQTLLPHPELLRVDRNCFAVRSVVVRRTGFPFELLERLSPKRDQVATLEGARRALHGICGDMRFLEAVLLSSSDAHDRLRYFGSRPFPTVRNYETRRRERLAMAYLQRFCARCETTSFFGPFGWSQLGDSADVELRHGQEERHVRASPWAEAACLGSAADPSPFQRALSDFAASGYPCRIESLARVREAFRSVTGLDPRRGAGRYYADRESFVEECVDRGVPSRLPAPPLLEGLRAVTAFVCACRHLTAAAQSDARMLLAACLPNTGRISVGELLDAQPRLREVVLRGAQELTRAAVERAHKAFAGLFALAGGDQHDVQAPPLPEVEADGTAVCDFFSPDLMIAGADAQAIAEGDFELVLGETHSSAGIFGYWLEYHPQPESVREAWETMEANRVQPWFVTAPVRNRLDVLNFPRGARFIGTDASEAGVSLRDLYVQKDRGDLTLRVPDAEGQCWLRTGRVNESAYFPLGLFARPGFRTDSLVDALLSEHPHLPRVCAGRTTLLRETWRFRKEELQSWTTSDLNGTDRSVERLRARMDMPRWVFLRGDRSPKPVAVDFDNPLSIEVAAREIRRACTHVTLQEMWPGPGDLWYAMNGGRYCCELRLTVFCLSPESWERARLSR